MEISYRLPTSFFQWTVSEDEYDEQSTCAESESESGSNDPEPHSLTSTKETTESSSIRGSGSGIHCDKLILEELIKTKPKRRFISKTMVNNASAQPTLSSKEHYLRLKKLRSGTSCSERSDDMAAPAAAGTSCGNVTLSTSGKCGEAGRVPKLRKKHPRLNAMYDIDNYACGGSHKRKKYGLDPIPEEAEDAACVGGIAGPAKQSLRWSKQKVGGRLLPCNTNLLEVLLIKAQAESTTTEQKLPASQNGQVEKEMNDVAIVDNIPSDNGAASDVEVESCGSESESESESEFDPDDESLSPGLPDINISSLAANLAKFIKFPQIKTEGDEGMESDDDPTANTVRNTYRTTRVDEDDSRVHNSYGTVSITSMGSTFNMDTKSSAKTTTTTYLSLDSPIVLKRNTNQLSSPPHLQPVEYVDKFMESSNHSSPYFPASEVYSCT